MILDTNNMFVRYIQDITDKLVVGKNNITVQFQNAVTYTRNEFKRHPYSIGDEVNDYGIPDTHRAFIRKTQSDFGWDWGPVFVPCGIYKDIKIITVDDAFVTYVVPNIHENEKRDFEYDLSVYLQTTENAEGTVIASVNGISEKATFTSNGVKEIEVKMKFTVERKSIELWWPYGYGKQQLYPLTVTLTTSHGDKQIVTKNIGYRTVELHMEKSYSDEGHLMYFTVNDIPVFIKGSNVIPFDAFDSRVTDEHLRELFQSAIDTNQNMLRIWGGGLYQRDFVYDMADEMGLMLWGEFMFACTFVPVHQQFVDSVRLEIRHQVRRLSHHTSIVMWSGNNENFPNSADTQKWDDYKYN